MSRRKEFELGPAAARSLYMHGDQHVGKPWHDSVRPGLGRKIGHGVYKRQDVQNLQQEASGEQRLFDPPPLAQPHEQTEAQYEKDPRTWWHGEYTWPDNEEIRRQSDASGGLHAGTLKSAHDRLKQIGPGAEEILGHKSEGGYERGNRMPSRLYAGRIHGTVNEKLSEDAGDVWRPAKNTRLYENLSEDRSSISAVIPHEPGDPHIFPNFLGHQEAIHEHLMAHDDPQAALERLHPRVRAEYLARGGSVGESHATNRSKLADVASDPMAFLSAVKSAPSYPNIGRQFSHTETYEHPDEIAERKKDDPEQLSMLQHVTVGSTHHPLVPGDYEKFVHAMGHGYDTGAGPPQMPKLKLGKPQKAF